MEERKPLTDRQQQVLNALVDFHNMHGYPPTYTELAGLIGAASGNSVFEHLRALKKKGYITIASGKARGIKVLGVNDTLALDEAAEVIRALLAGEESSTDLALEWLKRRGSVA
ncbi:SOS-response repressor and protease LexA (EC [Kosakonia radicincitans]|uniref:LexA family protein n=1 Tax=Kosakonia radicincitans TaxID=283686 RepID=UPI00125C3696|nr:LexA family transcriptional regulator [Kosakonia radicincitans]VVT52703.1 SOS-response repressor and protease LexA (EC [Kosakonia radicincitans]